MDKDKDKRIKELKAENARLWERISLLEAELHRAKLLDPTVPIVVPGHKWTDALGAKRWL